MCKHDGEFDDLITGQCVICATDPTPKEEYVGRGTPEHKVQKFGNKTRWRADANIGLRKIEKMISLSRSLIAELTEIGVGPINVRSVDQAACFFDVAGNQFFFTQDGGLTAGGCRVLIKDAKEFSVGAMARAVKAYLGRTAKAEEGGEDGAYPVLQPDGKFAIWNTVANGFSDFNLTERQALAYVRDYDRRKGAVSQKYRIAQIRACRESGRAHENANAWPEAVAWTLALGDCDREAFRKQIIALGLLDPATREQVDIHVEAIRRDLGRG